MFLPKNWNKANLETPVPQRAGVSFMERSLSDGVVPRDWPIFDPAAYYATALAQLVLAVPPAAILKNISPPSKRWPPLASETISSSNALLLSKLPMMPACQRN